MDTYPHTSFAFLAPEGDRKMFRLSILPNADNPKRGRTENRPVEDPNAVIVEPPSYGSTKPHNSQLVEFWRKGKYCDVIVDVEGQSFPAHRGVLAGGSDFFAHAFDSGYSEATVGGSLRLEQLSAPAYTAAAEFFYCASVTVDVHSLLPLLESAHFLQAAPLQAALVGAIAARVTPAWFMDAWAVASKLLLPSLEKALTEEVARNNDRLRAFSRSAEFGALPEVVRATIRTQWKELTLVMVRDGSPSNSKIDQVKRVLKTIGAQDSELTCAALPRST